MCGNKLGETDQYCQKCGASAGSAEAAGTAAENKEIKEEVVFNPPFESTSPFIGAEEEEPADDDAVCPKGEAEDLGAFISERELEAANRKHDDKIAPEAADLSVPEKNQEFTWNVHEFQGSKKRTDNTEFNWNMEEFGQPEAQPEAVAFERELFLEMREDAGKIREQNIDRFFTFSKKNEEFQELLDREYEKVKTRTAPGKMPKVELHIEALVPLEAVHSEAKLDPEVPAKAEAEVIPATEAVEPVAPEAEVVEPADPEIEVITPVIEAVEPFIPEIEVIESKAEAETFEPAATEKEAAPKAEHLTEMAKARAQFFGEELVRDNDSIVKILTPESSDKGEIPEVEAPEDTEDTEAETLKAAEEPADELQGNTAFMNQEAHEDAEDKETETHPQNPQGKRITVSQIALVIIAIVLAAEIGILGIRYFAPESAASDAIENVQTKVIRTVTGWFETKKKETDQTKDEVNQDNKDQTTDEDSTQKDQTGAQEPADTPSVPTADPNPMADKNALVSSQLGYNANIEKVSANDALAWKSGTNYGLSDINSSVPITNNIWQAPETGDPVYYDKSIVGAVIAFDSQWIDYVNTGNKGVLDLLKKDSKAYQNTLAYKKAGKIKETFKLLEIGEIRQGSKGYYVWVHEEIQIAENGTTTNKKYNWIYCLEPVDGKMKIVNYLKF
jgi:hypothetical protein